MTVAVRNNVNTSGRGAPVMLAHGFGCDQTTWRFVEPALRESHCVVLFDLVGSGRSDLAAYSRARYASLHGYADDVLQICRELALDEVVFVGHSVSAMIGMLAALKEPKRFPKLVMVGGSPRYLDDEGYVGVFTQEALDGLLDLLDSNYLGWSTTVAPMIMGTPERPELTNELVNSFCRTDPAIARHFARVNYLSDHRADLPKLSARTLVLQTSNDVVAPRHVGEYLHRNIPNSEIVFMQAHGHCPHLSAPEETVRSLRTFL